MAKFGCKIFVHNCFAAILYHCAALTNAEYAHFSDQYLNLLTKDADFSIGIFVCKKNLLIGDRRTTTEDCDNVRILKTSLLHAGPSMACDEQICIVAFEVFHGCLLALIVLMRQECNTWN
jgi:hypothetical protein